MIIAGMVLLAMISAAVMFAAAVRCCKGFSDIDVLQRMMKYISLG
jgi:hypothetical protein